MQPYPNPNSGISAFTLHETAIDIEFREGARYRYDEIRPGPVHVAAMHRLALAGRGLATYISRHVRDQYARKLRSRRDALDQPDAPPSVAAPSKLRT